MQILEGMAPLMADYDAFVLDVWGVAHDGEKAYPGVADALARMQAAGKRTAFLSNAPRRSWVVERQLERMGVARDLYDGIITSGELVWRQLRDRSHPFFAKLGDRAFHIGPERDLSTVETLDIELVESPSLATFVLNTGPDPLRGPTSVVPYEETLAACAGLGLPMVVANADRAVMIGGERLLCAGALGDRYREMGGEALDIGKPDPAVYGPVLDLLGRPSRDRVLAVGDSPTTDLAGAAAAGIDSLWALTGLTEDSLGPDPAPEVLARIVAEAGVTPIAALRGLRWEGAPTAS